MDVSYEELKKIPVNSKDQLYHIVRADSFAFCLICLEDIHNTLVDVGKHLNCENHQESIGRLFQACNPNVVIDGDEIFMDFVLRSVFDISVLLGEETCYICDRGGIWGCLMCEQTITDCKNPDTMVKDQIIDHVLSETHVNETKGVCFLYRLNSDQDFLLLNKSVVYCSVCKKVIQCREEDLLKISLVHLEEKKLPNNSESRCFIVSEPESFVKKEHLDINRQFSFDEGFSEHYNNSKRVIINNLVGAAKNIINDAPCFNNENLLKLGREKCNDDLKSNCKELYTVNGKSFTDYEFGKEYVCTCLLCKKKIKRIENGVVTAIDSHFKSKHLNKVYIKPKTTHKTLMDSVVFHNNLDEIKLISNSVLILKDTNKLCRKNREVKKNAKYIFYHNKKRCFCIVCMVFIDVMGEAEEKYHKLLNHFKSPQHQQCETEKMSLNQAFNTDKNDETIKRLSIGREKVVQQERRRKEKAKINRAQRRINMYLKKENKKITSKKQKSIQDKVKGDCT